MRMEPDNWDKDYWEKPSYSEAPEMEDATTVLCAVGNERYHYDWNWLMTVVDKIEVIKMDDRSVCFSMGSDHCQIWLSGFTSDIMAEHQDSIVLAKARRCRSRIEATFKAISQFIEWYQTRDIQDAATGIVE